MFDEMTLAARDGDAAILALWREWRERFEAPCGSSDEAFSAAVDALIALERRLYDTPATGPVGLAIKIWMLAFEQRGTQSANNQLYGFQYRDKEDYNPDGIMWPEILLLQQLIKDAVRIVPDLGPLSADFLDGPRIIDPEQE